MSWLKNVSMVQRILFAVFIAAMALPKQVVLVPWYVSLTSWEFTILFGQYLAFDWMAIWGLPHETVQQHPLQNCLNRKLKSTVVVRFVPSGQQPSPYRETRSLQPCDAYLHQYLERLLYAVSYVDFTSKRSISLGVATMQAEMATNYGLIMAGAALYNRCSIVTVFLVFKNPSSKGLLWELLKVRFCENRV